ncbi:DEAD/DEAH box helicase [Albibacillus kandeliae]|uniref:DEAD/DEAH box helicase n=1 Tax=Albibacillus kandeliae TaxID=2174228 RepID=UPI000D68B711|nr:DEAD/DEAH box helicase [Albibacillus kandeliae]
MIQTLSDALAERGYDTLTPVQEAVTDPALSGSDLLVSAQTGSGKTVGFGLAIGPTILDEAGHLGAAGLPLALVVAPTRELAFQVKRELDWLYARAGARVTSCVGGMDMRDERRALERGAHIVVGTPGRLRDHIQRGSLDMSELRAVVLDEADEMLDLGFREDLEFMLGEAPEDRRTLLFSATVPPMIANLAKQYQRDAVRVTTVSEKSQHADIAYQALQVAQHDAENAIINVLRYHEAQNAIVFANTRAAVNRLTARFANRGFQVVCLSGELSQQERSHALQAMRDGRARVCVATDVAARGIDLPNLELVIHAELPSNVEGLLHRSGRTGRAGRKGISALVVPPKQVKKAERLLKWAKVTAEWTAAPGADDILRRDEERLLANAVWTDEMTADEADFAARLLEAQTPQAIAAACLRLYRSNHSAPEELGAPAARPERGERPDRPERKDHADFGPSAWVALSVGRGDNAEARWLLPLLLRAGGLEKSDIGAIRVQQDETFVELAEPSLEGFWAMVGEGGALEEGVSARAVDGVPEFSSDRGGPSRGAPRGGPRGAGADRKPHRGKGPKPEGFGADRKPGGWKRDEGKPAGKKPYGGGEDRRDSAPYEKPADKPYGKPEGASKPRSDSKAAPRSKPARVVPEHAEVSERPRRPAAKYADRGADAVPKWKKAKTGGTGKKAGGDFGGKRPAGGKPAGKFAGKPGGKPAGKPAGKTATRSSASDTSKRFTPPKGAKRGKS